MIYITFVEILGESLHHFELTYPNNSALARFITALTFYMGIGFGYGIDAFVHYLENNCLETGEEEEGIEVTNADCSNISSMHKFMLKN